MTVNELRDFIFENYYKRIGLLNDSNYHSMKCSKKPISYCLEPNK